MFNHRFIVRLGKLACPRVNDDQKIDVDDQKWNSGRPHDYWILESLFYKTLLIFPILILLCKRNSPEDDHKCVWTTSLFNLSRPLTPRSLVDFS